MGIDMKKFLALLLLTVPAFGQFTPPTGAAYVYNSSTFSWQPLAASSGTAVSFTPPAVALYGQLSSGAWTPCLTTGNCGGSSSSGTVTSVSDLSPLFTTTTRTTTPTFVLSNAAQNSVFAGPASGGAGAPSYQTAPTFSAANLTNFPTLNQNTTGSAGSSPAGSLTGYTGVAGDVVTQTGTLAGMQDSGTLLSALAPLSSPAFSGTPTAPTAAVGTNTTQIATMAAVQANATRIAYGWCSGAASSSTTLSMYLLGTTTTTCTGAGNTFEGVTVPFNTTASNLSVRCGITGVSSLSGVFTLYRTPVGTATASSTALTATYGTTTINTLVQDTSDKVAITAGDTLTVKFTTQASETIGNCAVSFQY